MGVEQTTFLMLTHMKDRIKDRYTYTLSFCVSLPLVKRCLASCTFESDVCICRMFEDCIKAHYLNIHLNTRKGHSQKTRDLVEPRQENTALCLDTVCFAFIFGVHPGHSLFRS